VVVEAADEADRILAEAREQARQIRLEAEDYVDAKLAQFEIALRRILEEAQATTRGLAKTLDQVEQGRERLRAPLTAAEAEFAPGDTEPYDEEQR
jgi:cell division septum initiation protein DivIVA